ncbi:MAG: DUF2961 domain-containing protein [Deltaproteobacteria bacterium]|nr:DUF2961 domain-containing protein [Deltaproteobacteria bacterium]
MDAQPTNVVFRTCAAFVAASLSAGCGNGREAGVGVDGGAALFDAGVGVDGGDVGADSGGIDGGLPDTAPAPYGLAATEAFYRLPYLQPHAIAGQQSSYDRSGGNADGFGASNYLYTDGDKKILLDLEGPGVVYRMWFTGFDPIDAYIKVYFDGESSPRIFEKLSDVVAGVNAPFLSPLAGNQEVSSGGCYSYLPLPFAKSIKIVSNGAGFAFFYHLGYHLFDAGTVIETWTGGEDSSAVIDMWRNAGQSPFPTAGEETVSGTLDLAAGAAQAILDVAGPREITALKIRITGVDAQSGETAAAILGGTRLVISWDGEESPSVDAPLGSFFAMGEFGAYPTRALPVGMDASGTMYSYFPMPFERAAKVGLKNERASATPAVSYEVVHRPFADSFADVGHFKTAFRAETPTTPGDDILILDTEGSGRFLGVVESMKGPENRSYLEGDERIYMDGSRSPAFHGTGTEDFYSAGWYFSKGLFSLPMHGNTAHIGGPEDKTAAYRFLLHDAVPFRTQIRVSIEHGPGNDVTEDVWTLAYYYHRPEPAMVLSDTLDVGNAQDEAAHSYVIESETWNGSRTFTYEGDFDDVELTDDGRAHKGKSGFALTIDPANDGVVLRRRLDYGVANQRAEVFVDGTPAGIWYTAGSNVFHPWKDSDFMLPASLTSGKSTIRVKIAFVSGANDWNEFRYEAYSVK